MRRAVYCWASLIGFICLPLFAGCPDYSHQRPVPDYGDMNDSGSDEGEPEDEEALKN